MCVRLKELMFVETSQHPAMASAGSGPGPPMGTGTSEATVFGSGSLEVRQTEHPK